MTDLRPPDVARPQAATSAPRVAPDSLGKVLIVDDDEALGDTLRRMLERRYAVTVSTRALQALELLKSGRRYDAILCDLLMPELSGMDLYDALLQAVPEQARRMIFLTGGASTLQARMFLSRTVNPRLEKPFDLAALLDLIKLVRTANG